MRPDTPFDLSPEDRFQAIAALLARGVLRLLDQRSARSLSDPAESAESPPNTLELTPVSRLSGHHG